MSATTAHPTVFVSYSSQDEAWKDRLVKQLQVLELEGDLEVWDDRRIEAGDDWQPEIEAAMARARVAVLLVSVDFLTSGFIRGKEVPELLRRRESEGLRVIPVIVDACPWKAVLWLAQIQGRPTDNKALASFPRAKAEQLLADLAMEIRGLLSGPPPLAPPPRSGRGESESASSAHSGREGAPSPAPLGRDGAGGLLHNLPYPPLGDLFTGRQEELAALEATTGTAAITQSAAISGLGGIGKTRLAVEYAWRSGNRYTAMWFVRADSPENLRRNLAAMAGPDLLNLPEWEAQKEEQTIAAVKRWLREHPGWLMILDNVDSTEAVDAVLATLPSLSSGHVLITSRLGTWPPEVQRHSLKTLSLDESVRFLLHRTEGGRERTAEDADKAGNLAQRVDGLPLALEQAAAYMVRHRMRIADYLQAWESERQRLLSWFDPKVMRYPDSVAVTWKQTFDRLSPTPAALLRLTAFLAPDPIPFDMLEREAERVQKAAELFGEETGKAIDGKDIREAAADLADYSLITRLDGGIVVVHPMVQEVLRSQIPEEHRRFWIEKTLRIVNSAAVPYPDDVRTWPAWDRIRSHVVEVISWADKVGIVVPTSRLLGDLGVLLWAKGLFREADPVLQRALNLDVSTFGSQHPNVGLRLDSLALLLKSTNRLGEAEQLMHRARAIFEVSLGPKHPYVARALSNLSGLLQETNRLEDAKLILDDALTIDEASQESEHRNTAKYLNNTARLLKAMNRLDDAEPLIERALAIDEASFGEEHPRVAIRLGALATLQQARNQKKEAEPLLRRALRINEIALGPQHPNVATALNNLAWLLRETNRLEEAEPLIKRALDIDERSYGGNHPEVATDLNNLALVLYAKRRSEEAEPMMRRAVEIYEKSLGPDHVRTINARTNLNFYLYPPPRKGD